MKNSGTGAVFPRKNGRKVTLRSMAAELGVSQVTVMRALSGHPNVRPKSTAPQFYREGAVSNNQSLCYASITPNYFFGQAGSRGERIYKLTDVARNRDKTMLFADTWRRSDPKAWYPYYFENINQLSIGAYRAHTGGANITNLDGAAAMKNVVTVVRSTHKVDVWNGDRALLEMSRSL